MRYCEGMSDPAAFAQSVGKHSFPLRQKASQHASQPALAIVHQRVDHRHVDETEDGRGYEAASQSDRHQITAESFLQQCRWNRHAHGYAENRETVSALGSIVSNDRNCRLPVRQDIDAGIDHAEPAACQRSGVG